MGDNAYSGLSRGLQRGMNMGLMFERKKQDQERTKIMREEQADRKKKSLMSDANSFLKMMDKDNPESIRKIGFDAFKATVNKNSKDLGFSMPDDMTFNSEILTEVHPKITKAFEKYGKGEISDPMFLQMLSAFGEDVYGKMKQSKKDTVGYAKDIITQHEQEVAAKEKKTADNEALIKWVIANKDKIDLPEGLQLSLGGIGTVGLKKDEDKLTPRQEAFDTLLSDEEKKQVLMKPDIQITLDNKLKTQAALDLQKQNQYFKSPKFRADVQKDVKSLGGYKWDMMHPPQQADAIRKETDKRIKQTYPAAKYGDMGGTKGWYVEAEGAWTLISPWNE